MSFESQVKPSPTVHHSTPSRFADCSSPTFQRPDLTNWMTQTVQPRVTARMTVPKAAVDLPLPSPVLTMTTDGARTVALAGASSGTSWEPTDGSVRSGTTACAAPPTCRTRTRARYVFAIAGSLSP